MMRDPTSECSGCGSEELWLLHNIRHRGTLRRVCTSCVLKLHPGSFCPHCFEVYEGSIPPLHERVMCLKCSSVSHLACVGLENARQYVCPSCSNPSFLFFGVSSGSNKKSKVSANGDSVPAGVIDHKLAKVFLSAARIAASSMAKAAATARVEAERRVKEAAVMRKKAKDALEKVASLMEKEREKEKEKKKGKDSKVAPASVMEQNKKAIGNIAVAAAVVAQKPIQNSADTALAAQKPIQKIFKTEGKVMSEGIPTPLIFRTEGKVKSEGIPMPLTTIASSDKDRWAGIQSPNTVQVPPKLGASLDHKDKHKGPSAIVACQKVPNPLAVSENENSSKSLDLHNHVVVKESNGVYPVSPVAAGQLQHSNNHGMEEDRGKSGRFVDSDTGSPRPQSIQDPLASTTNSDFLLTRSSNTAS